MTQRQFDKLKPLPTDTLNAMADELDGSLTLITLYSKNNKGNALFSCNYEGHEELLFNSLISLFKNKDRIGKLAREAFLSNLHDETVAGYNLKDE